MTPSAQEALGTAELIFGADRQLGLLPDHLPGARVPLVRGGESRTVRFRVGRPGDYRFVCTIHEAQGSVGRLVVRAAP